MAGKTQEVKKSNGTVALAEAPKIINLKRLVDDTVEIPIVGLTPVIPHRWSEKAKRMMLAAQQTEGKTGIKPSREAKNPENEAEASLYKLNDGRPGIPSVAFKATMVEACRLFNGITMTEVKRLLYVHGEAAGDFQLVPIIGDRRMREDTPRNANGVADLRYRFQFDPWSALIKVSYPRGVISAESVVALLDAGGRNGVCDWRPGSPKSNTGTFGTFRVEWEKLQS